MKLNVFSKALVLTLLTSNTHVLSADSGTAIKQPNYQVGDRLKSANTQPKTQYKETTWESLVPAEWNPDKIFQDSNMDMLSDSDPRAMELLKKLKDAWSNAPVEKKLNGAKIRIPGFVVPLEGTNKTFREFLLVPYFGACIHTPPPPANQIIYVTAVKPLKNSFVMDAVWVSGTLETTRTKNDMGDAGYKMTGEIITPYRK